MASVTEPPLMRRRNAHPAPSLIGQVEHGIEFGGRGLEAFDGASDEREGRDVVAPFLTDERGGERLAGFDPLFRLVEGEGRLVEVASVFPLGLELGGVELVEI